MRVWAAAALAVPIGLSALAAGLVVPRLLVPDGVDRFQDDPAKHFVAADAYRAAWLFNDNPIGRALTPAARVTAVEYEPGNCPPGEPGADSPYADYTARIRFYALFAIPGPSMLVTCGGWRW